MLTVKETTENRLVFTDTILADINDDDDID